MNHATGSGDRIVASTGEWITRLADEERKRDGERARLADVAARKAQRAAQHGQRLLDELRAAIVRDIEMFRNEFPGDARHQILFEAAQPDGAFLVRKPERPAAALSVVPHPLRSSVGCEYRFTPPGDMPPREERLELVLTGDDGPDAPQVKHNGTGQVFASADALSEYLLVPIFTGRPR